MNKNKINLKGVPKDVWARILGLFLVLANLISNSLFGFQLIPFSDAEIYEGVSWVIGIVAIWLATYKNNDFSEIAQEYTKKMREEKEENK